jgi:hypothetical protein
LSLSLLRLLGTPSCEDILSVFGVSEKYCYRSQGAIILGNRLMGAPLVDYSSFYSTAYSVYVS